MGYITLQDPDPTSTREVVFYCYFHSSSTIVFEELETPPKVNWYTLELWLQKSFKEFAEDMWPKRYYSDGRYVKVDYDYVTNNCFFFARYFAGLFALTKSQ